MTETTNRSFYLIVLIQVDVGSQHHLTTAVANKTVGITFRVVRRTMESLTAN